MSEAPISDRSGSMMPVCATEMLAASGKLIVSHNDVDVVLFWNNGEPAALNDQCIHRERSLSQGVLLNHRVVCPGHQWSFDLTTGFCRERDRTQPTYRVSIEGGMVLLSATPVHE